MGRKKKLEKSIESFKKQIEIHKKKIEEHGSEKDYLINYWEGEIKEFEEQIEKIMKKLKK